MSLYDDTLALLQELIRNACVNDLTADSGQEIRNVESLERFFAGSGVAVRRFEPHPGRTSIAFSVEGSDPAAEPLTLLGHIDVVPVDEPQWSVPPFGAEIIDGKIYGRGAMDMLFITATMAAVTREVARAGGARGTLTFVALADEEARGGLGAGWIAQHEPEAFSWRNCLSETGGSHLPTADSSDAVVINVGEKGAAQRRLHVTGDAGHGSTPHGKDSAIVKIGEVARRIAAAEPPVTDNAVWRGFVQAFRFDPATEHALLDGTGNYEVFGDLAAYAQAFSHNTFAQTALRAGGPINVLPSHAWLDMDIRPLPGTTQEAIDAVLREALGDLAEQVRIEHLITEPATESPASGPLWEAMVETIHEEFPQAEVVPVLATGGSDLRFARRLGGVGYGFALHARERTLAEANKQLHSHDEHLHLEDLRLTVHAYRRLVRRFLGVL
ncbi:M20/M25/M40 family metallo-hydrolase [Corynebacterium lowii]|uniref:Succinyl-diaminopimelate desuccinylase n=1 Tax=Corynebacterium lowii TaxID=1544413 RepID=A0A0Q1E357_9CORY|nr:M20/M25/M40 family metallo-hydrolase [Corynebacterium lowii]KQB87092.1 Succinyl-diaminopimelate desuccinylase [Corynebacterium lowii]MDP9852323.1 acetylornithine deacetylase/succinyl-diaminopimelate desuccinylase-like protein [Corynebacterium lowii]